MSEPMYPGVGPDLMGAKRSVGGKTKTKKSKSSTETVKIIRENEETGERRIIYSDTGSIGGPEYFGLGGERIIALPNTPGVAAPDVMVDVSPDIRVPEQHRADRDGPVVDYGTPGQQVVVVPAVVGKAPRRKPYGPAAPNREGSQARRRLDGAFDDAAQAEAQVKALRRELFELRARHPEEMDVDSPTPGNRRRLKGGYLTPEQARRRASKQRQRKRLPWEGRKYISSKASGYRGVRRYERRF